jgi:hypothetical protein
MPRRKTDDKIAQDVTDLDRLWTEPRLVAYCEQEAKRLAKLFGSSPSNAKEIYRTLMGASVNAASPYVLKNV